jgi:membrane protein
MSDGLRRAVAYVRALVQRLMAITSAANLDLIAAGVAFYAMLAVFPAVAAVVALLGFVADPALVDEQLEVLRGLMPPEAFALLDGQVSALIAANSSVLGWATLLSLGAALWSTRAGVGALVRGLNAVYGLRPRAGFWHSAWAMALTLVLIGMVLLAFVAVIVVPVVLAVLPLGAATSIALVVLRWAMLVSVGLSALWLVYRYGPNHGQGGGPPRWTGPGVLLALVLWLAPSWGFSTYLGYVGSYNRVYGSIGAVVLLLMWFFLTAYAVLLGAALNRALTSEPDVEARQSRNQ